MKNSSKVGFEWATRTREDGGFENSVEVPLQRLFLMLVSSVEKSPTNTVLVCRSDYFHLASLLLLLGMNCRVLALLIISHKTRVFSYRPSWDSDSAIFRCSLILVSDHQTLFWNRNGHGGADTVKPMILLAWPALSTSPSHSLNFRWLIPFHGTVGRRCREQERNAHLYLILSPGAIKAQLICLHRANWPQRTIMR
jgi:hypothetical protein